MVVNVEISGANLPNSQVIEVKLGTYRAAEYIFDLPKIGAPAVYRIITHLYHPEAVEINDVVADNPLAQAYVGETRNLGKRMAQYATGSPKASPGNRKVHRLIYDSFEQGLVSFIHWITDADEPQLNGKPLLLSTAKDRAVLEHVIIGVCPFPIINDMYRRAAGAHSRRRPEA